MGGVAGRSMACFLGGGWAARWRCRSAATAWPGWFVAGLAGGWMRLIQLESVEEIRRVRAAWDRLWARSGVTLPTARAELVAQWLEHFVPSGPVRVVAVEEDGELLGLLPLAGRRIAKFVRVGDLSRNYWSPNGDLLVDGRAGAERVLARLADGLAGIPWVLAWLEIVPWRSACWLGLAAELCRRGLGVDVRMRGRSAEIALRGGFEEYEASRCSRLRYQLRRNGKRLAAAGPISVCVKSEFTPEEAEHWAGRALAIERRSWKHRSGSSVLGTPGMRAFFVRQARTLAEAGQLRVALLEHGGQGIAFELGYSAKGVYHSAKIGYDQAFRQYGPGQLLRRELIRWLYQQPGQARVDFHAELTPSLRRWSNDSYPVARVVVAPRRWSSRLWFFAYRGAAPWARRLRAGLGHRGQRG